VKSKNRDVFPAFMCLGSLMQKISKAELSVIEYNVFRMFI
jgi:hypothetical protein